MDDMEMWWSLIAFLIAVSLVGCPDGAKVADHSLPSSTTHQVAQ